MAQQSFGRGCLFAFAFSVSLSLLQHDASAQQWTPTMRIVRGELVAPAALNTTELKDDTYTEGLCTDFDPDPLYSSVAQFCVSGDVVQPPEVVALARALHNDPNLIYEYVRDRIDTEFLFGSHKGPLGVIIDGSGTAFDQAALMVELLRAASITANYRFGQLSLSGAQFEAWTGITLASAACEFLATGGIPAIVENVSEAVSPADCDIAG